MRTDDLVGLLAGGETRVEAGVPARRFTVAMAAGAMASTVLMASWLGVRRELLDDAANPMIWVKFGFAAVLAAVCLAAALRLSRPGVKLGGLPALVAVPFVIVWVLAGVALLGAAPAQREALVFGETWAQCPFNIAALSVPVFFGVLWAMRGLAPTRLRLAGAAAGLLSGATGALVYALHCPELAAPFLGLWYVLGILIPAAVGAATGPRLLRW